MNMATSVAVRGSAAEGRWTRQSRDHRPITSTGLLLTLCRNTGHGRIGGAMGEERASVLLVERSRDVRDRIGGWLEEAGYDVLNCPGPTAPDYRCVAGRGGSCPFVHGADAVVLDLLLDSDAVLEGTSAVDL